MFRQNAFHTVSRVDRQASDEPAQSLDQQTSRAKVAAVALDYQGHRLRASLRMAMPFPAN